MKEGVKYLIESLEIGEYDPIVASWLSDYLRSSYFDKTTNKYLHYRGKILSYEANPFVPGLLVVLDDYSVVPVGLKKLKASIKTAPESVTPHFPPSAVFEPISWPDVQNYFELPGFRDNCHLILDDLGYQKYGDSSYFCNKNWIAISDYILSNI